MTSGHFQSVAQLARVAAAWLRQPQGQRVALAVLLVLALEFIFALADLAAGLPLAREGPAVLDGKTWVQAGLAALVAAALAASLVSARAPACALETRRLTRAEMAAATASLAIAVAATMLFVASPVAFHEAAQEDRPLEWASALLLLAASLIFARHALQGAKAAGTGSRLLNAGVPAALAAVLFLIGMEEISWMQRLFGFATPPALAEVNWQGEFNLHNVQTDLSEFVYYVGAGFFLTLLPLVRDIAAPALASHPLARFVPGRVVAAVSAPAVMFTYGRWNLFALECLTAIAIAVLAVLALAASRRGDRGESRLLWVAALALAAGQGAMLAFGRLMVDVPDSTEYRELFLAAGLACFALTATRRT
jgi:hypothetical protein